MDSVDQFVCLWLLLNDFDLVIYFKVPELDPMILYPGSKIPWFSFVSPN
jgi:hypothetical protein